MPTANVKELFAQKITSREQFDKLLVEARVYTCNHNPTRFTYYDQPCYSCESLEVPGPYGYLRAPFEWRTQGSNKAYYWPQHAWWMLRERLRMALGIYTELPEDWSDLFDAGHCVHVSQEDQNMLAYTASVTDGENDRQVRIAPGKLARKLCLWLSDADVQALEASYRATMNDEIEFITGADQIAHAYQNMVGDSGCMRYSPGHFGLPGNLHPSMVYDAPGFALAVHRVGDAIKGRAITWVNPADETDKRYVRVYGDSVLERKLKRKGYVHQNLYGALLKKIPWPRQKDRYVMPYIDMPGGGDGTYGRIEGDGILLITKQEFKQINEAFPYEGYAAKLQGTDGHTTLKPIPANAFSYTCAVDGQTYNRLQDRATKFYRADGTLAEARESNLPVDCVWVRGSDDDQSWPSHPDCPRFESPRDGYFWVDNEKTRVLCGFVRLSPKHYPNDSAWFQKNAKSEIAQLPDGTYAKAADVVRKLHLVDGTLVAQIVHESEVQDTDVLMHKDGHLRCVAAAGVEVRTTPSGRKVHPLVHDVVRRYDGVWDFKRNVTAVNVFRSTVYVQSGRAAPPMAECLSLVDNVKRDVAAVLRLCKEANRDRDRTLAAVHDTVRRVVMYRPAINDGQMLPTSWSNLSVNPYAEVRQQWEQVATADRLVVAPYSWDEARLRAYAKDALTIFQLADAALAEHFPETEPAPTAEPVNQDRFTVAA
jgi:hypothetical protein